MSHNVPRFNARLYRGDDETIPVTIPSGLAATSWRCQARDGDGGLLFDLSGVGAPPAEIEVDGDLTDGRPTGQYSYDVECLLDEGDVLTIQRGYITLEADVTSDQLPALPITTHGLHVTPEMYDALAGGGLLPLFRQNGQLIRIEFQGD